MQQYKLTFLLAICFILAVPAGLLGKAKRQESFPANSRSGTKLR